MDEKTFKERTKKIAVQIIKQVDKLLLLVQPMPLQINLCVQAHAGAIGANYRAACRAKSTPDMINKMKIVEEEEEEESDETAYWLEILAEAGIISQEDVHEIYKETNEILAMTVSSIKTLRNRKS